jgi:ELWxxDGT repeat protein
MFFFAPLIRRLRRQLHTEKSVHQLPRRLRYEQLERREVLATLGPAIVADINPSGSGLVPGGGASSPYTPTVTAVGDRVYFEADDGVHGHELWVSDGTEEGTHMVVDAQPGTNGRIEALTAIGENVYFVSVKGFNNGSNPQLWVTGAAGTHLVNANGLVFTAVLPGVRELDGEAYFVVQGDELYATGLQSGLWKANGADATLVRDDGYYIGVDGVVRNSSYAFFSPELGRSAVAHGFLYFTAISAVNGSEIWRTNGSTVERVTDIVPGSDSPTIYTMYSTGDKLYFTNDPEFAGATQLWVIDGPGSPATLLRDFSPASTTAHSVSPVTFGGHTYFWVSDGSAPELWRTDGTVEETTLFFDALSSVQYASNDHNLLAGPDGLYFFAGDANGVNQLWSSDGIVMQVEHQVSVYAAFSGVFDNEVVYFDGLPSIQGGAAFLNKVVHIGGETLALPENVSLVRPRLPNDSGLAKVASTLFFPASSPDSGVELWRWELEPVDPGTNTVRIDIKPGDDANTLNLASKGLLTVALFTSNNFDATQAAIGTIVFAGAHVREWQYIDVDGDGRLDLLLSFRVQETNLHEIYAALLAEDLDEDDILDSTRQQALVELTGETEENVLFGGEDQMDLFLAGKSLRTLLDQLAASGAI